MNKKNYHTMYFFYDSVLNVKISCTCIISGTISWISGCNYFSNLSDLSHKTCVQSASNTLTHNGAD